jgi:hypothetical protein
VRSGSSSPYDRITAESTRRRLEMRSGLAGGGIALAVGALVALGAAGSADDGATDPVPGGEVDPTRVTVESADREPQRGGKRGRQALTYFEVPTPIEVPPKTDVEVVLSRCPRGSKAVTGYFDPEKPGTFLHRSRPAPGSARMWTIAAYNSTDTTGRVTFGLVCLSKVK